MRKHFTASELSPSTRQRFWKKVDRSGDCWLWTACCYRSGYGCFAIPNGVKTTAHRVAWTLVNGDIPDDMWVLHKCDVKPCCNPAHLFLGNHVDNMRDMVEKGRSCIGDRNGSRKHPERLPRGDANGARLHPERIPRGQARAFAKLTTKDVPVILKAYATGEISMVQLAKQYGINPEAIRQILTGRTWGYVADPKLIEACKERTKEWGVRLTEDDVRTIRARYAQGNVRQRRLAIEYGVSESHIKAIVGRRIWKHIT